MTLNRKILGVIGSGSDPQENHSLSLGKWIAEQGFHLVNGGGGGTMEAVSRGFQNHEGRSGLVLGVLPAAKSCATIERRENYSPPLGYPNPHIDIPIRTHLSLSGKKGTETGSRNHIVVLTADLVIALSGAEGTRTEIQLCLEYKKPLIILNADQSWNDFQNTEAVLVNTLEEVYQKIIQWNDRQAS